MLKILVRLYLVIIVAYAGALLFIPDTIVGLFRDRFMAYNLDQAKGVQALIVRQFRQAPREQWPAVEQELASDFAPLELQLLRRDQAGLSDEEQARLAGLEPGAAMLHTTIAPTMLKGSPKENVLPQDATAWINYRIAPWDSSARVIERSRLA